MCQMILFKHLIHVSEQQNLCGLYKPICENLVQMCLVVVCYLHFQLRSCKNNQQNQLSSICTNHAFVDLRQPHFNNQAESDLKLGIDFYLKYTNLIVQASLCW